MRVPARLRDRLRSPSGHREMDRFLQQMQTPQQPGRIAAGLAL